MHISSTLSVQDFEAAVAKQITAENERDAIAEEMQFQTETLNLVWWSFNLIGSLLCVINVGLLFIKLRHLTGNYVFSLHTLFETLSLLVYTLYSRSN